MACSRTEQVSPAFSILPRGSWSCHLGGKGEIIVICAWCSKVKDRKLQDVQNVTVYVGSNTHITVCQPLEIKQNPPNSVAAQFSLPWSLANAIIYRKLKIEHFSDENLKNQEAYQLAHKVVMQLDPQLTRRGERGEREPAVVEIRTREGMVYSKRVDHPLGSPENPLSMEGIVEKF